MTSSDEGGEERVSESSRKKNGDGEVFATSFSDELNTIHHCHYRRQNSPCHVFCH